MEKLDLYLQSNQLLYPGEGEKIITIVDDIWNYALDKGHVRFQLCPILTILKLSSDRKYDVRNDNFVKQVSKIFLEKFYGAIDKFLKIPDSCVQEKSVQTLLQTIMDVAVRGAM